MRWAVPGVLASAVLAGIACGGEVPSGPKSVKDGWEEWLGAPTWAAAPPVHEGFAPFVLGAQSDQLSLTFGRKDQTIGPDLRLDVAHRLRPVLGADADAVVAKVEAKPIFVRKGYYLQLPKRGENWPGAQTYTAYEFWELPVASLTASVPEANRDAATRALQRAEPEGMPAWESGKSAPAWVDAPTPREGHATVLVRQECDRADVARVNAMVIGPRWAMERITNALEGLLGRHPAFEAARHGETWLSVRARAVVTKGGDPVAWTLWDVPLDHILEKISPEHRAAAGRALETLLRPQ